MYLELACLGNEEVQWDCHIKYLRSHVIIYLIKFSAVFDYFAITIQSLCNHQPIVF